jgi:2-dehydro-3-deoxygluconokinase
MSQPQLVTFGETMAMFASTDPGPLRYAASAKIGVGGAESNVAIAAKRLGAETLWAGRRGHDALGERLEQSLRGENIGTYITVDRDAPTGLMVKERRTSSTTNVWYYRSGSAGSRLTPADLPEDAIRVAKVLHVTGITPLLSASARETTFAALEIAESASVPVSFDVNHRATVARGADVKGLYRDIAKKSSIVFAGDDEAGLLFPEVDGYAQLAREIGRLGPDTVVIKRGERGCYALAEGQSVDVPAIRVEVVDTVGAGDAFVAGYLARLLRGDDLTSRLATAVAAGGFACTTSGDWEGSPTEDELASFLGRDPVRR